MRRESSHELWSLKIQIQPDHLLIYITGQEDGGLFIFLCKPEASMWKFQLAFWVWSELTAKWEISVWGT